MKIFLLAFLFTNIIAQDFDYKDISDVFPSDDLSFKENQKYYNTFKKQLITLTASNQTDENWFMLSQFIIDFSEDFESDMENASEIINKALDVVLEGVTIGDIQKNPSKFSKHMYLMKRFINYLEHTTYEESGEISKFDTFSKSEKAIIFLNKIGLINNFNNILTSDSKYTLLKDFVSRNLTTPIPELMKSKEHPGVNLILNNPGSYNANIVQYVFYEDEDSIDVKFQIYLYSTNGELSSLDDLDFHIINIELSEETHPFFFDNGKNILREKINLYHKYLELNFNSSELALNFFDILIKPIIEYDKDFLNLDQFMLNQLKGSQESAFMGPRSVFILDNAISKIPIESLLTTQDYFINNILPFELDEYGLEKGDLDYIYFDLLYVVEYANTLNEVVDNMNRLQSKVEEVPGYNELVDYFIEKYKDGGKPSEEEIAEFLDSMNIQKYLWNQTLNINIFSMADFKSFEDYDLKKFNISNLSNLKFVNDEVDAIHNTIKKWNKENQTNIKSFNRTSSETVFKKTKFNKNDVIHIATHGLPLENNISALIFNKDSFNDGFLTYREVQELDIDARLVILSACSTNLGENYNNIHSLSIARAFKDIGVENVIGTLWPVDDKATAKFMEIFYDTLMNVQSRNIVQALKYTKLQMRQIYPNPHYWAGFVLYGTF